ASPPRAPRRQTARPGKPIARSKTAPGIFWLHRPETRPESLLQLTETHQESSTYVFVFVPGCAVAPNNAGAVAAAGMVTTIPGILPTTTGPGWVSEVLAGAGRVITTVADEAALPLIFLFTPTKMGNDELPPPPLFTLPNSIDAARAPGLPTAADGFVPAKNWDGLRIPSPNGAGYGYPDANGNVWVPTGTGPLAHGGPHWDVQQPGGGYQNVYPGGGGG
ncbi:MAG: polymorphic toxin type 37 domain-containing protein, partial [Candidatus Micrarchaeaceae archaeon]